METKLSYVAPVSRSVLLRYEENILSGENMDISITDPWSGLGEEEDW